MTLLPRAVTSPELALLRSDNQYSRLYMTIHVPTTVYTARLAAVPSSTDGVLSITYNSGSGTHTDILNDMTMYVGTTAGAYDLGMVRIRDITGIGATSGTFNIDEQSAVNWGSNCYLTVVDEFTIWRRNIRLQGTTPYIDEIAYTDQNSKCDPIPCFGPHRVLWYTGANISTTWDARDSWTIGNTINGYSWAAPGSVSSSGMTTSTPTIVYNAIGTYRVACTVTNTDGKSFTGYRYVFVVAEAAGATTAFTLDGMEGSYSAGGWKATVTLYDQATLPLIRDRALCVIHSVDYYGDTKTSLGFAGGAENIVLVGWINKEDIVQPISGMSGSVTFEVQTINYWLDQITAFPVGLKDRRSAPDKWTKWWGLTPKDVVWHHLHWRATTSRCTDFFPLNIVNRASRIEAPGGQTLWNQLVSMEWQYVRARPCADRLNRLHNQLDIQLLPAADRANVPTIRAVTTSDWGGGSVSFERVVSPPVGLVDMQGVAWDGTTVTPFASLSPGKVFSNWGKPDVVDRLVLYDQATTNSLCGAWFGWKNNQFPNIPMKILENERFIDIAPYMYVSLSIAATDNPRGVGYTGLAIPRQVRLTHNTETMTLDMDVNFEAQTQPGLAVTHTLPTITVPSVQPPPPVIVPPVVPPTGGSDAVEYWFATYHNAPVGSVSNVVWSGDVSFSGASQPTWNSFGTANLPLGDLDNMVITQLGTNLYISGNELITGTWRIWKCTNLAAIRASPSTTPTWTAILSVGDTISTSGGSMTVMAPVQEMSRFGESLIVGLQTSPMKVFGEYNGTSWTFNSLSTHGGLQGIGYKLLQLQTFSGPQDQDFGVFNFSNTQVYTTSVHTSSFGISLLSWRNGVNADLFGVRASYQGYAGENGAPGARLFKWDPAGGATVLGRLYTVSNESIVISKMIIRGAITGSSLLTVYPTTGVLWISEDRASVTAAATWGDGIADEAKLLGGGSIIWIQFQTTNSNEFLRVSNDRGATWIAVTGNYWLTIQPTGAADVANAWPVFRSLT